MDDYFPTLSSDEAFIKSNLEALQKIKETEQDAHLLKSDIVSILSFFLCKENITLKASNIPEHIEELLKKYNIGFGGNNSHPLIKLQDVVYLFPDITARIMYLTRAVIFGRPANLPRCLAFCSAPMIIPFGWSYLLKRWKEWYSTLYPETPDNSTTACELLHRMDLYSQNERLKLMKRFGITEEEFCEKFEESSSLKDELGTSEEICLKSKDDDIEPCNRNEDTETSIQKDQIDDIQTGSVFESEQHNPLTDISITEDSEGNGYFKEQTSNIVKNKDLVNETKEDECARRESNELVESHINCFEQIVNQPRDTKINEVVIKEANDDLGSEYLTEEMHFADNPRTQQFHQNVEAKEVINQEGEDIDYEINTNELTEQLQQDIEKNELMIQEGNKNKSKDNNDEDSEVVNEKINVSVTEVPDISEVDEHLESGSLADNLIQSNKNITIQFQQGMGVSEIRIEEVETELKSEVFIEEREVVDTQCNLIEKLTQECLDDITDDKGSNNNQTNLIERIPRHTMLDIIEDESNNLCDESETEEGQSNSVKMPLIAETEAQETIANIGGITGDLDSEDSVEGSRTENDQNSTEKAAMQLQINIKEDDTSKEVNEKDEPEDNKINVNKNVSHQLQNIKINEDLQSEGSKAVNNENNSTENIIWQHQDDSEVNEIVVHNVKVPEEHTKEPQESRNMVKKVQEICDDTQTQRTIEAVCMSDDHYDDEQCEKFKERKEQLSNISFEGGDGVTVEILHIGVSTSEVAVEGELTKQHTDEREIRKEGTGIGLQKCLSNEFHEAMQLEVELLYKAQKTENFSNKEQSKENMSNENIPHEVDKREQNVTDSSKPSGDVKEENVAEIHSMDGNADQKETEGSDDTDFVSKAAHERENEEDEDDDFEFWEKIVATAQEYKGHLNNYEILKEESESDKQTEELLNFFTNSTQINANSAEGNEAKIDAKDECNEIALYVERIVAKVLEQLTETKQVQVKQIQKDNGFGGKKEEIIDGHDCIHQTAADEVGHLGDNRIDQNSTNDIKKVNVTESFQNDLNPLIEDFLQDSNEVLLDSEHGTHETALDICSRTNDLITSICHSSIRGDLFSQQQKTEVTCAVPVRAAEDQTQILCFGAEDPVTEDVSSRTDAGANRSESPSGTKINGDMLQHTHERVNSFISLNSVADEDYVKGMDSWCTGMDIISDLVSGRENTESILELDSTFSDLNDSTSTMKHSETQTDPQSDSDCSKERFQTSNQFKKYPQVKVICLQCDQEMGGKVDKATQVAGFLPKTKVGNEYGERIGEHGTCSTMIDGDCATSNTLASLPQGAGQCCASKSENITDDSPPSLYNSSNSSDSCSTDLENGLDSSTLRKHPTLPISYSPLKKPKLVKYKKHKE